MGRSCSRAAGAGSAGADDAQWRAQRVHFHGVAAKGKDMDIARRVVGHRVVQGRRAADEQTAASGEEATCSL